MGDVTHLLKSHVLQGKPYNPTAILRILYEARQDYARLMGNESPYGLSPKVKEAIINELPKAHLYPDSSYYALKQALAEYTGFSTPHLVVGNGSTQFIDAFYYGFLNPGDNVLFIPPDYSPYQIRLDIFGGVAQLVPRPPPDYQWDVNPVIAKLTPRIKAIVVISPNNPVGNSIQEADFRRLLEEDLLVILDEAYFEFAGETLVHLINEYSNLVVTRTFAKAFGFAGLRLGYAVTNPNLAAYLEKVMHHFPVNRLTAVAAIAAIQDTKYFDTVIEKIRAGRTFLEQALNRMPNVKAFPSKTNFVLCKFTASDVSSYDIAQQLLQNGILVRDYSGKAGLEGQFIRITVGTQEQNAACITAIRSALQY